jgi:hypothetical protein
VQNNNTTIKANFKKKIEVHFDGGPITSDAGLFLYREFENAVPFMDIISRHVNFDRAAAVHDDVSVVRQMVYRFIAGYEDDTDADSLRADPLMPMLLDCDSLASQPTVSRCLNYYDMTDVWNFQRGNLAVVSAVEDAQALKSVTLDFDTTDIPTHGGQQGGRNNTYYDATVRQGLFCFNDLGNCVKGALINGTAAASRRIPGFCKGPLRYYLTRGVRVSLRADRAFGSDVLYVLCEKRGVLYYIRLKTNRSEDDVREACGDTLIEDPDNPGVFFGEYRHLSRGGHPWSRERRVCVKIQPVPGELFCEIVHVVTSDESLSPRDVIAFYNRRAVCENNIKEGKLGFSFKRLSHTRFAASALRLQIQILAYNVNNLLRRFCMPDSMRHHHIQTLRVKIIKIGARIVRTGRRFIIRCSAAYPFKHIFSQIHEGILRLKTAPA